MIKTIYIIHIDTYDVKFKFISQKRAIVFHNRIAPNKYI